MTDLFTVERVRHRLLGDALQLSIPPALSLRLLPAEAQSLARALAAVRDKTSAERQLFMSPMASDGYFTADVGDDGIAVDSGTDKITLDWANVSLLAQALRTFAESGA